MFIEKESFTLQKKITNPFSSWRIIFETLNFRKPQKWVMIRWDDFRLVLISPGGTELYNNGKKVELILQKLHYL